MLAWALSAVDRVSPPEVVALKQAVHPALGDSTIISLK